jgi:octaprenyl-diphosphate synthase
MTKALVSLEEIYQPVEAHLKAVPSAILDILTTPNELAHEVIRYFFSGHGKLLRPALTFLGAALKNAPPELDRRLIPLGASFEVFHDATLIHDDIIDSSYLRRNIPTINVKWGPEVAVLVGDYLHNKAIEAIFAHGGEKIISLFLQTAGIVCDGEIHELKEKDNFNLTEEEYLDIVNKKTAVLLACSVEAGAILAGAAPEEAEALKRYGRYFGIAFQIIDDCLDFSGQQQEFGKTLGADCAAGVLTLPLIRLLQLVDEKTKSEVYKIFKSEISANKFQTLLSMIREHGTLEYSLEKARQYCDKARLELSIFPDNPAKRSLDRLVDYVLERNR